MFDCLLSCIVNGIVCRQTKKTENLSRGPLVEQLSQIEALLAKNPYNDLLSISSTKKSHFYEDREGELVNRYQKPLSLYLQLLQMFAMPGTLVLDATCGTGSLELAAMEKEAPSGLEFVAFERNLYQHTNASTRLQLSCIKPTSEDDVMVDVISETHGIVPKKKEKKEKKEKKKK